MRYVSSHLIYFDEICMAMHISRSDPIGDQKFDNLKNWISKIVDRWSDTKSGDAACSQIT